MSFDFSTIPGNPYALIKDGVCVGSIAMQNYDQETIEQTLSNFIYDEVIVCNEIGYNIYSGQTLQEGVWAYPTIFKSWVLNKETRWWESPKPMPVDNFNKYRWSEKDLDWVTCVNCFEENNYSSFGFSPTNSGLPNHNEETEYLIRTAAKKESVNAN
jgi:hypothetical protein